MSQASPASNSPNTAPFAPAAPAIFLIDPTGRIKGANPQAQQLAAGSLEGREFSALFAFNAVSSASDWTEA